MSQTTASPLAGLGKEYSFAGLDTEARFALLDTVVEAAWERTRQTPYWKNMMAGGITPGILRRYLVETYHYVCQNAKNQALVALRLGPAEADYAKYCLKHALEENGHEQMCLHDLRVTGMDPEIAKRLRPLPATAGFIGYLYALGAFGNPVARLGYSYYAEGSHHYLGEALAKIKGQFGLNDGQMTFFVAHSAIDEVHFREVKQAIAAHCKTDEDWSEVASTITHVAALSMHMLDEILANPLE
jgi:pyrroloquinoline quinone (PQQ) biosynthesis protein C